MRRLRLLGMVFVVLLGLVGGLAPASAHPARAAYCGIHWGSLAKRDSVHTYTTAPIVNLRAGRHRCFDRLVIDLGRTAPGLPSHVGTGYQIGYASTAQQSGSGYSSIPVRGGAVLSVLVNAAAHDADYRPTYAPADRRHAVDVTGFRTFRQVAFLGTFEAQTEIALGVRARLPYRVFVLPGPGARSRLVIDVAHRW